MQKEKELTWLRDQLNQRRRELPWERVDKECEFDGAAGRQSLADLFDGRSQLIVYHAMFNPATVTPSTTWTEDAACQACSVWVDTFVNVIVRLNHRDVTLIAVSRAPYPKIEAYMKRMGWSFNWASSGDSDFNFDYGVSFRPEDLREGGAVYNYTRQNPGVTEREGLSVFAKDDEGNVFPTSDRSEIVAQSALTPAALAASATLAAAAFGWLAVFGQVSMATARAHAVTLVVDRPDGGDADRQHAIRASLATDRLGMRRPVTCPPQSTPTLPSPASGRGGMRRE